MVARVAARRGPQPVARHLEPGGPGAGHRPLEHGPGALVVDRRPVPRELVAGQERGAGPGVEPAGRDLGVEPAPGGRRAVEDRVRARLVRLPGGEADVALRAKEPRRPAELPAQLLEQRAQWVSDLAVVDLAMRVEVLPRVVRLEAGEPRERPG